MKEKKKRVVVGLSGGVDSAVAAALLLDQGYEVTGVFALGWTGTKDFPCNWQAEQRDAAAVAETLKIPFYTVNLSEEYEKLVIGEFLNSYKNNLTPNPDVLCNSEIKFKALWEALRQFEPDYFATGHYAKIVQNGTEYGLFKGDDNNKDQSYFLWRINRQILSKVLFPLGELSKPQVRKLAKKFKLPTATKKDSQGVCFIGPLKVRSFLAKELKTKPGEVVLKDGRKLAEHDGTALYTIGQRLGAGSVSWTGDIPPLFVLAKDNLQNRLIVGTDEDLFNSAFEINQCSWLLAPDEKIPDEVLVKIRYRSDDIPAKLTKLGEKMSVELEHSARAITPGQSAVCYDSQGRLLGGGIISSVPAIVRLLATL